MLKDTLVYKNVCTQRNTASTKNVRKNKYTLIYVHMQNENAQILNHSRIEIIERKIIKTLPEFDNIGYIIIPNYNLQHILLFGFYYADFLRI